MHDAQVHNCFSSSNVKFHMMGEKQKYPQIICIRRMIPKAMRKHQREKIIAWTLCRFIAEKIVKIRILKPSLLLIFRLFFWYSSYSDWRTAQLYAV